MNAQDIITEYQENYDVLDVINLDEWYEIDSYKREPWLTKILKDLYKPVFENDERIIFIMRTSDSEVYDAWSRLIDKIDISRFFAVFITNNPIIDADGFTLEHTDEDVQVVGKHVDSYSSFEYASPMPMKLPLADMTEKQRGLFTKNSKFCMYPWIHLHAYPTGEAWPCCMSNMGAGPVGNTHDNTMEEIWNSDRMKELRRNILEGKPDQLCVRCYEQEASGFLSGRQSANKHHGHFVSRVDETKPDGHLDRFEMTYWDIRFSNLCNLSCRSCGHIFSSSWYKDQIQLAGPDYAKTHKALNVAGRFKTDMFEQLLDHVDHVEQIYFAGGEPLMMDEHYAILDELEKRGMFHVRLVYNTNFTQTKLKDREVFDYWRKFDSVSVGASLDAMGPHAEYIRKGTVWKDVEANRRRMMEVCPEVDFYISPTLSIMNALHLPDFHRDWVEKGLLKPQDLNINILQDPPHYRIDIAPEAYKLHLSRMYEWHIQWLEDKDPLQRATNGFRSAINFLNATDNSHLLDTFWEKTARLDEMRDEVIYDSIPEMEMLHQ